jgi:asparagine synthase (glutamine-hydrolysing)
LLGDADITDPLFSHLPTFGASGVDNLYTPDFKSELGGQDIVGELRASLPTRFFGWSFLNRAAYLEMTTGLASHSLGSCLDRMTMAHGVQGRYPFLDHRVFEFVAALPTSSRLRGLRGQEVLGRWASRILPRQLKDESGSASLACDTRGLLNTTAPRWVAERLSSSSIERTGIFAPDLVESFLRRCRATESVTSADAQAFIGLLSTQLWCEQFVDNSIFVAPLSVTGASVLLSETTPLVPTGNLPDVE